jgi:hypothetical protein
MVPALKPGRRAAAILAGLGLLFAAAMTLLNASRSYHPDEAATFHFGELRTFEEFGNREAQHGLFYDAVHRWTGIAGYGEAMARLPFALSVGIAIGLVGWVALRLCGPACAAVAAGLALSSQYALQGATEVRFYGLLFALAAGCLVALLRLSERASPGALLALAVCGAVAWRIHPASAPWHGIALLAGGWLLVRSLWRSWRGRAEEGDAPRGSWTWRAGVAMVAAAAAGACVAGVHLVRQLRYFNFSGNVGESAAAQWTAKAAILRQGGWLFAENPSVEVFAAIAAWAVLAVLGAADAWRRNRWFAAALVVPLVVHTAIGFHLGTPRSLAIKYLTASFPAWVMLMSLGAVAAHGFVAARKASAAHVLAGALALGTAVLAWPRAAQVVFGDASHFRELRAALPATAPDGQPPLLIGPPTIKALVEFYTEHLGMEPVRFIDERVMPPWRTPGLCWKGAHIAVAGEGAPPPAVPGVTFKAVASGHSYFTPHWSWTLYAPATAPQPPTEMRDGELVRPGYLVDSAPFDEHNGPQRVTVPGEEAPRLAWMFVANEVAVYEMAVPADSETFFVETLHDVPGPPVFGIRADGRALSVQAVRASEMGVARLRTHVPEDLRGRTCRWRVRFLAGNAHTRANDDRTNAGYILSVGFESAARKSDGLELLRRELLVSPPDILREPMDALREGLGERLISVAPPRVSFRTEDGETIMRIDADEERQDGPILIPAFPVRPGRIAFVECEMRAVGVTDHHIMGMVGCVPVEGGPTRDRLFSIEPVGPGTTPWRRQVLFTGIPEGIGGMAIGWYVTRGTNPVPKRGYFEVRRLRVLDAAELEVPSPEPPGPLPLY